MDAETCATYFAERPAYQRIMEEMLRKYRGLGHVGGQICLKDATAEECQAARAVFGRPFSNPLKFKLQEFEMALQTTPYQGISLPKLLEAYFGTQILTRQEEHKKKIQSLSELISKVSDEVDNQTCRCWLRSLLETRSGGYVLVRRSLKSGEVESALTHACKSAAWLEEHAGKIIRLAVLSARVTSDPHTLDSNTMAGKLLLHLLSFSQGVQFPSDAEKRDMLYYEAGILCDSISSSVTQLGLILCTGKEEHPSYQYFRQSYEACTLTLTNLANLSTASSPSRHVYLVENQMVFSQLCDHANEFYSPLICTSGQLQVAVLRLMDMLAVSGTTFHYSGDFDGGGLSIADRLTVRYPGLLKLWHMSSKDYTVACSKTELGEISIRNLHGLSHKALNETATTILEEGYAGYQELLLPALLKDLTETP